MSDCAISCTHQRLCHYCCTIVQTDPQGITIFIRTIARRHTMGIQHITKRTHIGTSHGFSKIRQGICTHNRCRHWHSGHTRWIGTNSRTILQRPKILPNLFCIMAAQRPSEKLLTILIVSCCSSMGNGHF
jgi:hypothetical protein